MKRLSWYVRLIVTVAKELVLSTIRAVTKIAKVLSRNIIFRKEKEPEFLATYEWWHSLSSDSDKVAPPITVEEMRNVFVNCSMKPEEKEVKTFEHE